MPRVAWMAGPVWSPALGQGLGLVVLQHPVRRAVEIVVLTGVEAPHKGGKPGNSEEERDGYQEDKAAHAGTPRAADMPRARVTRGPLVTGPAANRMLLATTTMDEADIASAAISGVTCPAMASGTAMQL